MPLKIEIQAQAIIIKDGEHTYPHECCGFLYGHEDGDKRVITQAIEVNNTKEENRERRFEISSFDYMKAETYADEQGIILLGVYHSHPDHPAIPSEHDLKQALPYFSYIIASIKKGYLDKLTSWRLDEAGQFVQEEIIELDVINKN